MCDNFVPKIYREDIQDLITNLDFIGQQLKRIANVAEKLAEDELGEAEIPTK